MTTHALAEFSPAPGNWVGERAPDPALFFSSPDHDQILSQLRYLVEETPSVPVLIGPQGAGKTSLACRLQGQTPHHWLICRVDAHPLLHPETLLHQLARGLALPLDENLDVTEVHTLFAEAHASGRLPVVLVDDADLLPEPSLHVLLYLHQTGDPEQPPPFALILLAEPAIEAQLTKLAVTDVLRHLTLPLIPAERVGEYVKHFLRLEGVRNVAPFPAERLEDIYQDSNGLPGRINERTMQALRETAAYRRRVMGRRVGRLTVLTLAIIATCLLLTALGLFVWELLRAPASNAVPSDSNAGWVTRPLQLPSTPLDSAADTKNEPPPTTSSTAAAEPEPDGEPEVNTSARPSLPSRTPAMRPAVHPPRPAVPPPAPSHKPTAANPGSFGLLGVDALQLCGSGNTRRTSQFIAHHCSNQRWCKTLVLDGIGMSTGAYQRI